MNFNSLIEQNTVRLKKKVNTIQKAHGQLER